MPHAWDFSLKELLLRVDRHGKLELQSAEESLTTLYPGGDTRKIKCLILQLSAFRTHASPNPIFPREISKYYKFFETQIKKK